MNLEQIYVNVKLMDVPTPSLEHPFLGGGGMIDLYILGFWREFLIDKKLKGFQLNMII